MKAPPYIFLVLATLFWAGNFVFGQPLSEALPPFGINLIRWVLACLILVPLVLAREGRFPRPPRALWPALIIMSLSGVLLFNSLVYLSLSYTTSTNAALVNGITPVLALVLAAAIGSERLTGRRFLGAFISVAGVAWIVSRGSVDSLLHFSFNRGDLIMLAAALLWAVYTVLGNRVMRVLSPLSTTTLTALLGMPLLILIGGYELVTSPLGRITPLDVAGLVYVGVVASVAAFLAWNTGIERIGAARGSVYLNLIPVFTAGIAVATLGERIGIPQIVGGLLVILGVTIASDRNNKRTAASPPETS